ncbi:hypothetical protein HAX54_001429, partial [Datura stramonium]|nr:hypothetical protein [Datura stramonium]
VIHCLCARASVFLFSIGHPLAVHDSNLAIHRWVRRFFDPNFIFLLYACLHRQLAFLDQRLASP